MQLKKPKFWDYKEPNFISNLLFPISKLFEVISNLRKSDKTKLSNIKTICVGNIYLGGTGKTSIAIELKKLLDDYNIKSCFIKKDYSSQFDEQKLLQKFGKTFINKSRLESLKRANSENFEIAIFDDGLQDKSISYDLTFVCFNKKNFIGNGRVIPSGPLRESLNSLKKYQNIFLNGNDEDTKILKELLNQNYSNLKIYESKYNPINLNTLNLNEQHVVFSGIGNHYTFIDMLKKNRIKIIKDFEFPDHYNYNQAEVEDILKFASKNNSKILTTEKDYLRLTKEQRLKIYSIKIDLKINQIGKLKDQLMELI